jgi:2-oxoglutarate ferredoxin oxidoreductase subunit alpha
MTTSALEALSLPNRSVMRSRNFFALGVVSWLFHRPIDHTLQWINQRFKRNAEVLEANTRALKGGYNYAENTEIFASS